jgi:tRNA (Thr-GGU) A37 N-methylase
MSDFQFAQIGVIRSPYKEKFAVPASLGWLKTAAANYIFCPL